MTRGIIKPFTHSLESLQETLDELRSNNKSIGLCHGCFDLIHDGHIQHLKEVSRLSDYLVVSITNDVNIKKGPGRPVYNESERANILSSIRYVDCVLVINSATGLEVIEYIKPNSYFKGLDYQNYEDDLTGMIEHEVKAVESNGGKIVVTETEKKSSTKIINSTNLQSLDDKVHQFINKIREKSLQEEIAHLINDVFPKLKLSVFGDLIVDEYIYTSPVGTTTKSPAISVVYNDRELMLGGSSAIARHLESFAGEVNLFFQQGDLNWEFDKLLEEGMPKKVNLIPIVEANKYTPHKIRYFSSGYPNTLLLESKLDQKNNLPQKLFEMSYLSTATDSTELKKTISENNNLLNDQDIIAWADFGHGFLDDACFRELRKIEGKVLVNAQTNSSNYGFNLASKYSGASFFCLDELEARLLLADRDLPFNELWEDVFNILQPQELFVTRGAKGLCYGKDAKNFNEVPALATNIIDAVGAGDAVMSAAILCEAANVSDDIKEVLLPSFGAIACSIIGNSESVTKIALEKYIKGWI